MAFRTILVSSTRQFLGLALAELSNLLSVECGEGKFSYAFHQPTDMEFQRHSLANCGKCTANMASCVLKITSASNKRKNCKTFSFLNCRDNSEIMLILTLFFFFPSPPPPSEYLKLILWRCVLSLKSRTKTCPSFLGTRPGLHN